MRNADVFIVSDNILSPLGTTTAANFSQLVQGISGIRLHEDKALADQPFYAALFGRGEWGGGDYTRFEQLLIASIASALQDSGIDPADDKTVLIISTTKGNISLLETGGTGEKGGAGQPASAGSREKGGLDQLTSTASGEKTGPDQPASAGSGGKTGPDRLTSAGSRSGKGADPGLTDRISLHTSARLVAEYFGFSTPAIIASNACISGIMAILTGFRLLRSGQYENAVIAGADVISNFILSGFQSFQAISSRPCRPFDRDRDGITLGEGAATMILSSQPKYAGGIRVMGGSTSNDANHLSAPSRTGAELGYSIRTALGQAGLTATDIDFISAHGTATLYNDEMEAKAITLANLQSVPVNSLKGYYGHTLGAAGLIESIVAAQSLKADLVLPTLGFEQPGVSQPVNICSTLLSAPLRNCLKTASGFGGCNAALVLSKP